MKTRSLRNFPVNPGSPLLTSIRRHLQTPVMAVLLSCFLTWSVKVEAADFYWDTDGSLVTPANNVDGTGLGGTGTWDTGTSNWWDLTNLVTWPNANTDRALFSYAYSPGVPTLNTVTLSGTITANQLSFLRSGYTLTSGTSLTLAGSTPGLHANLGESATIASLIAGSNGLLKTGGGTIRLGNTGNTYTGTTTIANGTLVITGQGALGASTGAVVVTDGNATPSNTGTIGFSGGSLYLDGSVSGFTFSRDLSLSGTGTIGGRGSALMSIGNNTLSGTVSGSVSSLTPDTFKNTRITSANGTLTLSGTLNVGGTAGTTLTSLGGINQAGANFYNLTGALAGTGTLEKSGGGTLFLTPSSTAGFSGRLRISGSNASGQSTVRVSSVDVFGSANGTTTSATIDMGGGVLEIRSDSSLNFDKNLYQRASSTIFVGPAVGGAGVNGTATFGTMAFEDNLTNTFNSRNGYGVSFTAAPVNGGDNNSTITNNMGGTLSFTGNFWSNANNTANRTMTIGGNGNTMIDGNVIASAAAFDHNLTKSGSGSLTITGTGSTLDGIVSSSGGAIIITDFRSLNMHSAGTNTGNINIGSGGTAGALIIGTSTAASAAGLTASRTVNLSGSTGSASIYANQAGGNPVILNSVSAMGAGAKTLILGGTNTADNLINDAITNAALAVTPTALAASGSSSISIVPPVGTFVGQLVTGVGIAFGTTVASFTGTSITLSQPTTADRAATDNVNFEQLGAAVAINKIGGGTWVLAGENLFTGAVTISNGILKLKANAAASTVLSSANAITFNANSVFAGGTLEFVGQNNANNVQALGALTPTQGSNTIKLTPGISGTASLTFASLGTVGAGSGLNIVGADFTNNTVTIVGADGLLNRAIYFGGSDFAYRDANKLRAPVYGTDSGFETTATGPLTAASNQEVTGSVALGGAISINTLKLNGAGIDVSGAFTLTIAGGGVLSTGGSNVISTTTLALGTQALVARVNTGSLSISSNITGSGGLTKNGSGTLVLSGTNAQTGTISINEGTVQLSGSGRLGAAADLVIRQGAILDLNGVTPSTVTNAFNSNGTVTNSSSTAVTFTVGGTGNSTGTSLGIINQTNGVINLTKSGTGAQSWLGLSNYTGVTTIGGTGLVTVDFLGNGGEASGIGASTNAAANLVFSGTAASSGLSYRGDILNGILTLGSRSASTDRLFTVTGAGVTLGSSQTTNLNNAIVWSNTGAIVHGNNANRTFIFTGTSQGDNTFNPQLTDSTGFATSVSKTGTGIWRLGNSNNTYTGATTITQGILMAVHGDGLSSGSNLVFDGGTLYSSGNLTRNIGTAGGEMQFLAPAANTAQFSGGFLGGDSKLTVDWTGTPVWGSTVGFLSARDGLMLNGSQARAQGATGSIALSEVEIAGDFSLGTASAMGGSGLTYTLAQNSATVSGLATTAGLVVGQSFTGTNVPSGAYIVSINSATAITLSANTANTGGIAGTYADGAFIANNLRAIRVDDNTNTGADFATISGVISAGDAVTGLRKLGNGILKLTGANTYQGETSVYQGTLVVTSLGSSTGGATSSVGAAGVAMGNSNAVTLGNGGTGGAILQYIGSGETSDRKIRLNSTTGSTQIHADGSGALILTNVANDLGLGNKTLSLRGTNMAGNMITSQLSDNGGTLGVSVDGSAIWILTNGANNYTGSTTAGAGGLGIGHDSALGSGTLVLSNSNVFAYGADRTIANAVTHNNNTTSGFIGDYSLTFSGLLTLAASANNLTTTNSIVAGETLTFSGGVVANALTAPRAWAIDGPGETVITGNFTTSTAFGVRFDITGGGTLTLGTNGATSNWNQAITAADVDRGTLKFIAADAIPNGAATSGGITLSPELVTGDTATMDLNGFNQTISALTATSNGTVVLDNTAATAATLTFGANNATVDFGTGAGTYTITDSGAGALSLAKTGTGVATIGGGAGTTTLSYAGTTTVNGGILNIKTGLNTTSGITVAGGATLNLFNGVADNLSGLTTLNLGAGSGTATLGLNLGASTATSDRLGIAGAAVTANTIQFDITALAGFGGSLTYDLITAGSGLSGGSYTLGLLPGGFTYGLSTSDTLVQLTLTAIAGGDVYWRGGGAGVPTSWASVVSGDSNFSTDLGGATDLGAAPGTGNTVIFSSSVAPFTSTTVIDTTLDNNFFIDSLEFTAAPTGITAVTIAPGTVATNTLTIAPASSANGIDVASNAGAITISAPVVVGADQTWNVVGTGANGSSLTLSGTLTGTSDLTKSGAGTLTLSGDFSGYTGDIDLTAGIINIARTGTFTVSNLITSSTGGGGLTKSGSGIMTINNNSNTFTGPVTLAGGTLAFTTIGNIGAGATSMGAPTSGLQGTITSTANGVLSFVGTSAQSTDRAITSSAGALTLSANGDEAADTITYNGAITIGPTADGSQLVLSGTAGRAGIIAGGITQTGTTADVTVNGGTWTLTTGASTVADDLVVSGVGTILNLNSAGVLTFGASTTASLRVYSGATINLGANGAVTAAGFDGLRVGVDAGGADVATFNMNGFNLTVDEFILGNRTLDREGLVDGTGTLTVTGNLDVYEGTINANLASTGINPFQKLGHETVTLRGNNTGLATTGAGDTLVEDGTLILDYTVQNNAKINSGNELSLLGGDLILKGNNSAATTQSVTGLFLNSNSGGFSTITLNRGVGNNDIVLNLGAITRANSGSDQVIRFSLPGGVQSATNGITTTSPNSNYGTLGTGASAADVAAYATVRVGAATFFATGLTNGTNNNIVGLTSTAENDVTTWAVGDHVTDETTGFTGTLQSAKINSLRFNAAGGSEVNLAADGVLLIRSGGILVTDQVTSGTPGIFGGTLVSDVTELIVHQDSAQTFEISSFIGSQEGITKGGNGTLLLSGNNNYNQETELMAGTLQVSGGNALSDISIVNLAVNRNSTLELLADETIGRLQGGKRVGVVGGDYGTVAIGAHTLRILNTSGTTYSGFFTGGGTLIKDGSSDLNLQNTSTGFFGSIVINSGTLRLSNAATIAANAITVNKGGSLFLDMSSTTRSAARILDTTAITLNSADGTQSARTIVRGLSIFNDQDGTADETVGVVNVNSGASYVGMSTGDTNDDSDIIANNILRLNDATLNVRGTALGSADAQNNQFRIVTANEAAFTAANLVGGGGAAGTQNISIVPWAIGETFAGSISAEHMGNSLVTYVAGAGFRPLNFTTEYDTIASAAATDNARQSLAGDLTGLSGKTINSLVLDNANTAAINVTGSGAGQTLAVTSGAMLFTVSSPVAATNYSTTLGGFDSGITVGGTNEYVFSVVNPNNEVIVGGGATSSGVTYSTQVNVANTTGLVVGQEIYGQGIPVGAVITQIGPGNVIQISLPADLGFTSQSFRLSTMGRLTAVIASELTSAADITKSGRGTLDLRALTTAGGTVAGGGSNKTTINEGVLLIDSLENIGGNTGNLVFAGGVLFIDPTFTGDLSSRTITFEQGGGTLYSDISLTFANSLGSGVGGFTKFGSGNLTLNAASTRTGFTNILGGGTVTVGATNALGIGGDIGIGAGSTLAIGTNNISVGRLRTFGIAPLLTGSGTITASNGYFFTHESGDVAVAAKLAGAGGLFKYEAGSITLTGANTYTGRTEVQIGTLTFNSIANIGGGASALGAPTTAEEGVIHTGFGSNAVTLTYTGTGHSSNRDIQMNGTTGGLTINGNGTGALGLGSVQSTVTGNKTLTLRGTSVASLVNSVGAIREAGSILTLNKTDANTWMINEASSYTGVTQIDNGTLQIGVDDALPTGTTVRLGTGTTAGTLDLNGFNQTIGSLTVQSTSNAVTNNIIVDPGKTLTINGAVTLGVNANASTTAVTASGGGSIVVNSGGANFQVGGATGGTNDNAVTADFTGLSNFTANLGTGTFRLGDGNTGTENNASTFKLAVDNSITAANILIGDGTGGAFTHTLTLGSGTNVLNADTINIGSAGATIRSGGAVVFDAGDTTGELTVRASDGSSRALINMINTTGNTAGDMISTIDLTGHSADILGSTLTMAARSQGTGAGTATLSFDQGTLDVTTLNMASRTSTSTGNATATVNLGDSAALGVPTVTIGAINMAVNTSAGGTVTADLNVTGGDVTIGTGSGTAINMANAGTGRTVTSTIDLTGGNVSVTGDIIRTGGAGTENATVTLNGATLDMNGNEIGTLAQNVTFVAQSGTLSGLAELNGGGALNKTTVGTLILTDDNTYTGGTTVSDGILLANNTAGSATGTGVVTVQSGGTLSGHGSVSGNTTIESGGTVTAGFDGGSDRTLTFGGDLTAQSGSIWLVDLVEDSNGVTDHINVTGNLTITGAIFTAGTFANSHTPNNSYVIATYGGNLTGEFDFGGAWLNNTERTLDGGQYLINYGGGSNSFITLTAVPEPGTFGLLGLALAGLAFLRFRKRRKEAAATVVGAGE